MGIYPSSSYSTLEYFRILPLVEVNKNIVLVQLYTFHDTCWIFMQTLSDELASKDFIYFQEFTRVTILS